MNVRERTLVVLGLTIALSLVPVSGFAFDIPANDGFVTDTVGILTKEQDQQLEQELTDYRAQTSNEIAVVIVKTVGQESIADIGLQIGRKWGVGSAKNNGILVLIAYEDHSVWINVGYGLEGVMQDLVTQGIVDTDMIPNFRDGNYYQGIESAIDSIKKHIGGEYTADRYAPHAGDFQPSSGFVFFGFLLFQVLIAILGRTKSWWLGGVFGGVAGIALVVLYGWWVSIPILVILGLFFDFVVSKAYRPGRRGPRFWIGGGGFGGGSGGGGGFGGFGGGSFGGGGAGGKW